MQTIRVEPEQIKLPLNVFCKRKGKKIRFAESPEGFFIEYISERLLPSLSRLANLKQRTLIRGNPDDLPNIKVGEWNELKNL